MHTLTTAAPYQSRAQASLIVLRAVRHLQRAPTPVRWLRSSSAETGRRPCWPRTARPRAGERPHQLSCALCLGRHSASHSTCPRSFTQTPCCWSVLGRRMPTKRASLHSRTIWPCVKACRASCPKSLTQALRLHPPSPRIALAALLLPITQTWFHSQIRRPVTAWWRPQGWGLGVERWQDRMVCQRAISCSSSWLCGSLGCCLCIGNCHTDKLRYADTVTHTHTHTHTHARLAAGQTPCRHAEAGTRARPRGCVEVWLSAMVCLPMRMCVLQVEVTTRDTINYVSHT